jgi:hypothetical protein
MAAKATLAKIVFRQDPARGLMASVQVSRGQAELSKSLAKYAFAFEITS